MPVELRARTRKLTRETKRSPIAVLALVAGLLPALASGQFLPPGWLNPGASFDGGLSDRDAAQLFGPDGTLHAVWATQADYSGGSGTDPDIYYAQYRNGTWSSPALVNDFGDSDNVVDERPRIALGPNGTLHCVWQSQQDTPAATDGDLDVFYSRREGQSWSTAEMIGPPRSGHVGVDPNVAVAGDGEVVVVWRTPLDVQWDIHQTDGIWGGPLVRGEASGVAAMTTSEDGFVYAIWPYRQTSGKRTLKNARLVGDGPDNQFWPNFWDPDADSYDPAVVSTGSGANRQLHVAWATNQDRDGTGSDVDLFYGVGLAGHPYKYGPWPLNLTAGLDTGTDEAPSLCAEPGGVLHAVWQSDSDLFTGTDRDVYHAVNAGLGGDWSAPALLGWNGLSDSPGEDDETPSIACHPGHLLSGMWNSNDDLDGAIGSDWDVLHALGLGRLYHRPLPVPPWATLDNDDDETPAIAVDGDTLHVVWRSDNPGGGLSTGYDYDVYHVAIGGEGRSAHSLASTREPGTPDGDDSVPSLTVDPSGTLHVVWTGVRNLVDNDLDILHSQRGPNGWSPPSPVELDDHPGDGDDFGARLVADSTGRLHALWLELAANGTQRLAYSNRNGQQWSAASDPFAALSDWQAMGGHDLAVDSSGTAHVVFTAGSTALGDADVFYTRTAGNGWMTPEAVDGTPGGDGALDHIPALALTSEGDVIVVWPSLRPDQGAGVDADLWIARRNQSGWSSPSLLHQHFLVDVGVDVEVALVAADDHLNVVWSSDDPLGTANLGPDRDLFHLRLPLTDVTPAALPSSLPIGTPNPGAPEDIGDDVEPRIAAARGALHFVWTSMDTLGLEPGTGDRDVLHSRLTLFTGGIFQDDFESGTLTSWSDTSS